MIYLDYQATTPLAPEALEAMRPYLAEQFGNPHSSHRMGRAAAAGVELARDQLSALLPAGGAVSFTSGATEALNWAIKGAGGAMVTIATEHAAVLDCGEALARRGEQVTVVPVERDGLVDLDRLRSAVTAGTRLVAAMLVNNEIGVVQPCEMIGDIAHAAGALFLCDAVQGFGRLPVPANADLIAVSAHKIHGPKGIGALWMRDGISIEPLLHGGGQEKAGRSGTLAPALCAGFGAAARLADERRQLDIAHVERLWNAALEALGPEWQVNGSVDRRYRGNLNVRRDGLDVARLMGEIRDIAFSAGSACASGSGRTSHVLRALGLAEREARSSIRLGFGRYTSEEEVTSACRRIDDAARAQQGLAA